MINVYRFGAILMLMDGKIYNGKVLMFTGQPTMDMHERYKYAETRQ